METVTVRQLCIFLGRGKVAGALGVCPSTVSAWCRIEGPQRPAYAHRQRLARMAEDNGFELETPMPPITKKRWVREKLGWSLRYGAKKLAHVWPANGKFWASALSDNPSDKPEPILGPYATEDEAMAAMGGPTA